MTTGNPIRVFALDEATPQTSGSKASSLATLRRAGIDVPDGFVIPLSEYRRHHATVATVATADLAEPLPPGLLDAIDTHLHRLFGRAAGGYVAVRSSAGDEDGHQSSAAGQHDTILAVRGTRAVAAAVARCWASLHSTRATAYRRRHELGGPPPAMAVLVQQFVDADVAGVLFTQTPRVIEAAPGLGEPLVSGQVTPDSWTLDDTGITTRRHGTITHRLDRHGEQLIRTHLQDQGRMCLQDQQIHDIDRLGQTISRALGYDADVEWAIAAGRIHTLQARPITARVPQPDHRRHGIPASPGLATGTARVLRAPWDFPRLRPGDIIVCRTTDPAWTPLFAQAAGIITETGGLLSHAAIVARELAIPAILSVPQATTRFPDGIRLTIDGTTGSIQPEDEAPRRAGRRLRGGDPDGLDPSLG